MPPTCAAIHEGRAKNRGGRVHCSRVARPELRIAPDRAMPTPSVRRTRPGASIGTAVQEIAGLARRGAARLGFSIVPMQRGAPQRQAQSCFSRGVMRSPTSMP